MVHLNPDGVTYGECGSAYIYLVDEPGSLYHIETGFDAVKPTEDFYWDIYWDIKVEGPWDGGTDHFEWDDGGVTRGSPYWNSGPIAGLQGAPSGTVYFARVTWGVVITTDGSICFPYGPTDSKALFS